MTCLSRSNQHWTAKGGTAASSDHVTQKTLMDVESEDQRDIRHRGGGDPLQKSVAVLIRLSRLVPWQAKMGVGGPEWAWKWASGCGGLQGTQAEAGWAVLTSHCQPFHNYLLDAAVSFSVFIEEPCLSAEASQECQRKSARGLRRG